MIKFNNEEISLLISVIGEKIDDEYAKLNLADNDCKKEIIIELQKLWSIYYVTLILQEEGKNE